VGVGVDPADSLTEEQKLRAEKNKLLALKKLKEKQKKEEKETENNNILPSLLHFDKDNSYQFTTAQGNTVSVSNNKQQFR
jgi:hypothetical protein